jgi:hypothetical protein
MHVSKIRFGHAPLQLTRLGAWSKWLKKRAKKVRTFTRRPPYVGTVVSYPKSGRTWLRLMLADLQVEFDFTHDGASGSKARVFDETIHCRRGIYWEKPVIFLSRDPRDTAVSAYFQKALRRGGFDGTISDFIRDSCWGVEKIVNYNLTWLERGAHLPTCLPITYEEMSADTVGVLKEVLSTVGLERSMQDLENAVAAHSFDRVRERESREDQSSGKKKLGPTILNNPESFKARRGKIGGFVDYLSADDVAFCSEVLNRYHYFDEMKILTSRHVRNCGRRDGLG